MDHILTELSKRYPQLLLPISDETRNSEAYKNAVLRGAPLSGIPEFSLSEKDRLEIVETPAGKAEVLTLWDRADFEHCIRALAHRCMNAEIPETMGASTISGLINWEKIRRHQEEYLAGGGGDWDEEFARFTADRKNYRDTIIVLSSGFYSALSPEKAGFPPEKWLKFSLTIRKYHELAHFVSRALYPDHKEAVRDEVLADMNGIISALGRFDADLLAKFLGITGEGVTHGRLENYVPKEELSAAAERVRSMLSVLTEFCKSEQRPFEALLKLEEGKVFL